jgi:8-oxo-dGTP pyrophosphatase MutT (NUDIX family)
LPGGGVRGGESDGAALTREVWEELGIVVAAPYGPPLTVLREPRPGVDPPLTLRLWRIDVWDGEPTNLAPGEHDEIRWFEPSEAARLDLLHPGYAAVLGRL